MGTVESIPEEEYDSGGIFVANAAGTATPIKSTNVDDEFNFLEVLFFRTNRVIIPIAVFSFFIILCLSFFSPI